MEKQARKAVGVDSELKAANLNRLKRIEGQVRGLQKMVEDDRYLRGHPGAGRIGSGSVAGRGAKPDEESPTALRDEGDQQRQTQGDGGDVRRTAGAGLQAFAVKGAEGRASPAPTSEKEAR